jgi:glutathione S-transferase
MPMDANAAIEVTALAWVPPFARGQVRDLRVRWALEEAGLPYKTRLIDKREQPQGDTAQPWGQVPVMREGDITMFECGAIALHIAEKSEALLPSDPGGRATAITWLFAALNSIDPMVQSLTVARIYGEEKGWASGLRETVVPLLEQRLAKLAARLGDKDWLDGRFTVGDLMMVATLRTPRKGTLNMPDNLIAYIERGEARPAFQAALAAHLADFMPDPESVPA